MVGRQARAFVTTNKVYNGAVAKVGEREVGQHGRSAAGKIYALGYQRQYSGAAQRGAR